MATVAELEVVLDATDKGVATTLARLNKSIELLQGKKINVDIGEIDTERATAELEVLKELIDSIDGRTADANVNFEAATADFEAAFAMVEEQITQLDKERVEIKTDLDYANAVAKVEELEAIVAALDGKNIDLQVDVDIAGAIAKVEALKLAINGVDRAARDVEKRKASDLDTAYQKLAVAAQRVSVNISGMTAAVLSVGPALIPIAAAGTAAVGAMGMAAVSTGAAFGAFAFTAVSALSPVAEALTKAKSLQDQLNVAITEKQKEAALLKLKALYDSLDPAQLAVVQGVQALQAQWASLTAAIQPQIYTMAAQALKAISAALPGLVPFVKSAVAAFAELQTASLAALGGPVWSEFFDNIKSSGGPAMESLGRSLGNVATGIAGIFNAFFPYQGTFLAALEAMTKKFSEWAAKLGDNPEFKAFIDYVKATAPAIKDAIIAIAGAFKSIVIEAAPIGTTVVKDVTALANAVSALHEENPGLIGLGLAMAGIGAVVVNIGGPILAFVTLLRNISGVVGAARTALIAMTAAEEGAAAGFSGAAIGAAGLWVAAIAAVVAIVIAAYKYIDSFRASVNALGEQLSGVGATIGTALKGALSVVTSSLGEIGTQISTWAASNTETFRAAWENIKAVVGFALAGLVEEISSFTTLVTQTFGLVWTGLGLIVKGAWDIIVALIKATVTVILGIITVFASAIAGDWKGIWDGVLQMLKGFVILITGAVKGLLTAIAGVIEGALGIVVGAFRMIWDGVAGVTRAALKVIGLIPSDTIKAMVAAILAWGKSLYDAGAKVMGQLADGIKAKAQEAVKAVSDTMDRMASYLPGSPAEVGPLSGHGYVKLRGQRFMDDLAIGLDNTGGVEAQVRSIAASLAVEPVAPAASRSAVVGAYTAPASSGGTYVTVAAGAVTVDARGSSDAAAVSGAATIATAELANQLRIAINRR